MRSSDLINRNVYYQNQSSTVTGTPPSVSRSPVRKSKPQGPSIFTYYTPITRSKLKQVFSYEK